MPNSLISTITGAMVGSSISFSAKNELTGVACWTALKIKDVEITSNSANTSQPVSSESLSDPDSYTSLLSDDISNLKIIQPAKMRITAFATDIITISNVAAVFNDKQATLTITTKGIVATGLALVSIDIEQSPEMTSAAKMILELEQTFSESNENGFSPAQSSDASILNSATSILNSAKSTVNSLYNKISNSIGI